MTVKKDNKPLNSILRQKAEELLKQKLPGEIPELAAVEMLELLHEFEVHKVELELQMEELLAAKEKAVSDARKYSELYDFAPSGYITLSREGEITEINLHGAQMLGKERSLLMENRFCSFLNQESLPLFQLFLDKVFQSKIKETCVVSLLTNTGLKLWSHISAKAQGSGDSCDMTIVDITEQRNAEEILQDIIENNPMSIQIVDRNGFTLNTNSAHTRLFGAVPPPEFSIFHDLQSKDPAFNDLIQQARNGEVVHFPDILYNPRNAFSECPDVYLWIRAVLFPLKSNQRNPDRFVLMHENITEQKQNEAALRFRNSLLSTLQDVSIDGILVVDENNRILFYNKQFVEMWSVPAKLADDGLDEPMLRFVAEQMAEQQDFLQKVLYLYDHPQETSRDELILRNGRIFDRYSAPMFGADQQYFGRVWYFRDITEAKNSENQIKENEERYRSVTESVNDAIISIDSKGGIWSWNPGAARIFGYSKEEITGKSLSVIMPERLVDMQKEIIKRIQHGEDPLLFAKALEVTGLRKNGMEFPIELSLSKWETASGKFITGIVRDITDRKQAEKDIISAKEKAEESDQLKTAFLQNISHEIRTPLNSILGFSKLLKKPGISEEKLQQFSGIIIKSSEQLLTIVNDIITISSLETRQEKLTLHEFSVNELISDLLIIFNEHSIKQHITLTATRQLSDKESQIITDKGKLIQILSNLLINALKFTHKGFVEFGYRIEDPDFVFYVKDSGIGIRPEMQQLIFDRFRQGDLTIPKEYGGTGLGLAISKGFVELLGGRIWVESEPGKGAVFYFTIPSGRNR